ncbi:MAG TPA: EamA family transporter [Ferruginibacter sp.]|nr:EamA family transporter [Niastella sp.]HPA23692.1 EamA family transporter [Ferruginibacter sp.]
MIQNIKNNVKAKAYLALFATSTIWGTTWVASKMAVAEVPALQMSAIRQFIAGSIFISYFLFLKKMKWPSITEFRWLTVMALLMFVFANGFSTWGVKYIPAGMAALIGTLYPLSVVIIEALFYGKRNITPLTLTGLILGISGVALVFYENAFQTRGENYLFGILVSLLAMISWSLGTVFLIRNKRNINPYYGTGWQMFISSFFLYALAWFNQPLLPLSKISWHSYGLIFYLVLLGSILAFIAFIYTIRKLPAPIASLYAYINPLVAMVVGAILLSEKITVTIIWGAIVTLTGVFLVNYSVRRNAAKIIAEAEI